MNTSEPELPQHLYIHSTDPDDTATRAALAPDKLISWSQGGRGDAIDKWCQQICDSKLAAINSWHDNRILQLEDEWASTENHVEDEDADADEERYHQACEAVTREAQQKRALARKRMAEHKAAIEKLVQQARAFSAAHTPPPQEDHLVGYLIAIAAVVAVAYMLIS
jgi:hypothetical protein